jgi:hypothetical protein
MDVDTKERFSQVKIKFPPGKVGGLYYLTST